MAKKTGLGRGLESLMGEANAEVGSPKAEERIKLSQIKPNKAQPRKLFDKDELEELAESIRQEGVLQPIIVRKKGSTYEIVMGERRYQAAKLAGLKEIPALVRDIDDADVLRLALIENLQRSDLNPIEEARSFKVLIDRDNLTQEQLAKLLSKSRSSITNTLRLLDLPKEAQDMLFEGRISAGHARAILAVPGDYARIALARKVVEEGLSVRQTEALAPLFANGGTKTERAQRVPQPSSFKRAKRELRMALDTNVEVKTVRGKNKVMIEFETEDDLRRLVELLTS